MFSKSWTTTSTSDCSEQIEKLKYEIKTADAIVIGAGAGLSASAGFTYTGERFEKYFGDFIEKAIHTGWSEVPQSERTVLPARQTQRSSS